METKCKCCKNKYNQPKEIPTIDETVQKHTSGLCENCFYEEE